MTRRSDSGSVLVESIVAIILMGFIIIMVGRGVAIANGSISSAQKHAEAVSLLAELASDARAEDCVAASADPVWCRRGLNATPATAAPGGTVTAQIVRRGTEYTVVWTDSYEAPRGRDGALRPKRSITVSWTDRGLSIEREGEALGSPQPAAAASWIAWPVGATPPTGSWFWSATKNGTSERIPDGPQERADGGGWSLVAAPGWVKFCSAWADGACLQGPKGLAELAASGRCTDDGGAGWTVPVCSG